LNIGTAEEFVVEKYSEMLKHIARHRAAGQKVPADAIESLAEEGRVFGDLASNWCPEKLQDKTK
jgi:hypothetical protein